MRRLLLVIAPVAVIAMAGCGGDEADDATAVVPTTEATTAPQETSSESSSGSTADEGPLDLVAGAVVAVDGFSNQGEDAPAVPMEVAFTSMDCSDTIVDGHVDEFDKVVDVVAETGSQLCLVELEVTNVGDESGWFSTDLVGTALTESGTEVAAAARKYDPTQIAVTRGQAYVGDFDGIEPGESAFDFVVFETDEGQTLTRIVFSE